MTRRLRIAVQMDEISSINIASDSTLALMLEAQRRGHELWYYTPDRLSLCGREVIAHAQPITVRFEAGNHFSLGAQQRLSLASMDVVLMRQDPPFDMAYITATHILEHLPASTLVVNNPAEVRNAPEKIFVMQFADLMPPTLISRDREEIELFRKGHGDVVMKPLYGNGGRSIFLVHGTDQNAHPLVDLFSDISREPWVIQAFIPAVSKGDKRIVLIDGEPLGAINRVPAPDDIRSNLARGGSAHNTDLTPREREICQRLAPELQSRGLLFTGIDVIDGLITEINVTSPTGLRAIKKLTGIDLTQTIWEKIEAKI